MKRITIAAVLWLTALAPIVSAQPSPVSKALSGTTCPGAGCLVINTNGQGSLGVQIDGTFVGTAQFEFLIGPDDGTWKAWLVTPTAGGAQVSSATAVGAWTGTVAGFRQVRIRFSAYTSGTAIASGVLAIARNSTSSGGGTTVTGGPCPADQYAISIDINGIPTCASVTDAQLSTSDITTNNATIAKHGLLPKLPNAATQFLNGAGSWTTSVIAGGTCTNQAVTALTADGVTTCTTLTSAYVNTSIAQTGVDINTSNQVTATHLAAALPVAQGGSGAVTLTGLLLGNGTSAFTPVTTSAGIAGALSDETGSGALVFGTSPTLGTPTIANYTNATHTHQNAAGGGTLDVAAVASGIFSSTRGGTGNGFFKVSGPTTAERTLTFPDASATVLTSNAAVTVAQGGTGVATLAAHGILVGEGTGNVVAIGPSSTSHQPIVSGGASADPAFGTDVAVTSITFPGAEQIIESATDVLEQRRGANGQTHNVYGTFTDASNYSRLSTKSTASGSTRYFLTADTAGTGDNDAHMEIGFTRVSQLGQIQFFTQGTCKWYMDSQGAFSPCTANARDIGDTTFTIKDVYTRHVYAAGGTAPTISSGGGGTASAIAGRDEVMKISIGTSVGTNSVVINFGTTWAGSVVPSCNATNTTSFLLVQAVPTTTTLTLNSWSSTTATAANFNASDIIRVTCKSYQ